jgi:hypothetical protein
VRGRSLDVEPRHATVQWGVWYPAMEVSDWIPLTADCYVCVISTLNNGKGVLSVGYVVSRSGSRRARRQLGVLLVVERSVMQQGFESLPVREKLSCKEQQ